MSKVTYVYPCGHTLVRDIDNCIKWIRFNNQRPILAIIPEEVTPSLFKDVRAILNPCYSLIVYQGKIINNCHNQSLDNKE